MALLGSRGSFEYEFSKHSSRCLECGRLIVRGGPCLVSRDVAGRVRKRVCSQECREDFDADLWDAIAKKREWRRDAK